MRKPLQPITRTDEILVAIYNLLDERLPQPEKKPATLGRTPESGVVEVREPARQRGQQKGR